LGPHGGRIPQLGLGCMELVGASDRAAIDPASRARADAALDAAVQAGIRLF
jgi:aryl-alcohol dehydrogenase-like predicted oxidoreductase